MSIHAVIANGSKHFFEFFVSEEDGVSIERIREVLHAKDNDFGLKDVPKINIVAIEPGAEFVFPDGNVPFVAVDEAAHYPLDRYFAALIAVVIEFGVIVDGA